MATYRETLSGLLLPEERNGTAPSLGDRFRERYIIPRAEAFPRAPGDGGVIIEPFGLFVARLQSYSKLYFNPDEAYRQQRKLQVAMERDPVCMEPLFARMMSVALLEWEVVPEEEDNAQQKQLAQVLAQQLKRVPFFTKLKMSLLWALWYGKNGAQIQWQWSQTPLGKTLAVRGWSPVRGDKITFDQETGQLGVYVNAAFGRGRENAPPLAEDVRFGPESRVMMLDPWRRDAFICHKHEIIDGDFFEPESAGAIHGLGLRHRVWWPWWFKQNTLQWVMEWVQRLGTGFTIWYFDQDNPESEAKVREAAEKQKSGTQILFPRGADAKTRGAGIERIEAQPGGAQFLIDLLDKYWGNQIKMMIAGQTLTSEVGATGLGGNVAEKHENTKTQMTRFDALNLDETITNELLGPMVRYRMGAERGQTLGVRYQSILEKKEPEKVMAAVGQYLEFGGEAPDDYVREVAGIPKPKAGEKTLKQQQPGGMPGMPGAPGQLGGDGQGALPFDNPDEPQGGDPLFGKEQFAKPKLRGPFRGERGGKYWINEQGKKVYPKDKQSLGQRATGAAKSVAGAVGKAEHAVADSVKAAVAKLPPEAQKAVTGVYTLSMSTFTAGRKAAEAVAKERGMPPDRVERIGRVVAAIDLLLAKPMTALGGAAGFIPAASIAYLGWSAARDPMAVMNAAFDAVGALAERMRFSGDDWRAAFADGYASAGDPDWYGALFCAAFDRTEDPMQAIGIARQALGERERYASNWSGPQQGARGGKFWVNKKTGEKSYQEPGEGREPAQDEPTEPRKAAAKPAGTVKAPKNPTPAPPQQEPKSEKAQRAAASAVRVDKDIQRYSEERNEPILADVVGGDRLADNEPIDVVMVDKAGKRIGGIELKTCVVGANHKLTMKKSAMERKAAWEKLHGAPIHTVVFDDKEVYSPTGDHDVSKRRIYYKRGYGSFRVGTMHEVKSTAELKQLIAAKDDQLPPAAKRMAGQSAGSLVSRLKEKMLKKLAGVKSGASAAV